MIFLAVVFFYEKLTKQQKISKKPFAKSLSLSPTKRAAHFPVSQRHKIEIESKTMLSTYLITGANAGLGKETAKQLALKPETKKIYLGCRNRDKALMAQKELEMETGKFVFEILDIDVSSLESVKAAVVELPQPVDALVMNAGGVVGSSFHELDKNGVTQIFSVNLLGHTVLTEELIKAEKLTKVAIYAGSEAARGVKEMGMQRPDFPSTSTQDFLDLSKGELYGHKKDATVPYGPINTWLHFGCLRWLENTKTFVL